MAAKKKSLKPKPQKKSIAKKVAGNAKIAAEKPSDRQHHIDLALEAAQVGIWEWFIKTGKVRWSDMTYKIFDVTKKEFKGDVDSYQKLIHPDDRDTVAKAIQETISNKKIYSIQHRVIWRDGSIRWIEASGNGIWDAKGNCTKLTGTAQDITSKKQVELEKEDWKTRYEIITTASGQVIYDYDIASGKIVWSGMIKEVLGYSPEEMDDIVEWTELIHREDRSVAMRKLEEAEEALSEYDIQYRIKTKSGDYSTIHDRGFFLADGMGKAYRMLGTMQDITQQIVAQEQLDQSNRLRESIESAMPGVLYVFDVQQRRNIYSNRSLSAALGYSSEDIKGLGENIIPALVHPEDINKIPAWSRENFGTVKETEYRMKTKSGQWRWFLGRDTVFQRDSEGNVLQIVGLAQDITERKEAEVHIHESEASYRTLFNSVEEAIYIQDNDGTFIDVNDGACKMYGYERSEFIGRSPAFLAADGKNDFNMVAEKIKLALEGVPQTLDFWGKKKNGKEFLKEVRIIKGFYFGKDILISTARDITERKKIEEELRESEQRFRTLQQASFGGIGIHDKGLIMDCNQGLCDITGYSREDLIGFNGLLLITPEFRDLVMEKILTGYEKPYDVEGIRKDGTRFSLEVQAKNIPYQGKMIRVTEFRDITERKLAEIRIMEQNAKLLAITEDLKRKNDQLEEFTQIVSHNLRSPVGNILTLLSFFEGSEKAEEKAEYLSLLKESSLTTQQTLHELNEVLKIKQNKNIPRQDLSFEKVLQQVKSMLSAKITEVSASIEGDFKRAPNIHYPNIYLESIFLNLLSNSLKYIHVDRKPEISFRTFHSHSSIILEVSDNGLGINLERYGHQVFKLHKTFHKHPESRGIGLFMIKNQIEALGGEISIASQVDKGTTIFVNFNKYNSDATENSDNSVSG